VHSDPISHVPAVRLEAVRKVYGRRASAVEALRGVSLQLAPGTFTAIMGPSGSGKSTLLHCAAGLDRPTDGQVTIGPVELSKLNETQLTELRRDRVGFVFQAFNLVPALTVEQNVALPLRLAGGRADPAALQAVLARVGLGDRRRHRPAELSGGQQQRVAIARALVTRPDVLFAEELSRERGLTTMQLEGVGSSRPVASHQRLPARLVHPLAGHGRNAGRHARRSRSRG
jgi:putative ABC transport system ATP-binding protein